MPRWRWPVGGSRHAQIAEQQQRQEAYQRTSAYQEEQLSTFRERLETVLSSTVRQALDLAFEWVEWLLQPRAVFRLESGQGSADCTIHFGQAQRIWTAFIPNPYRPELDFVQSGKMALT